MKRYSELLYWTKYRDFIHYNEKTNSYFYDKELPERAKQSFEKWLLQFDHAELPGNKE